MLLNELFGCEPWVKRLRCVRSAWAGREGNAPEEQGRFFWGSPQVAFSCLGSHGGTSLGHLRPGVWGQLALELLHPPDRNTLRLGNTDRKLALKKCLVPTTVDGV